MTRTHPRSSQNSPTPVIGVGASDLSRWRQAWIRSVVQHADARPLAAYIRQESLNARSRRSTP